jgi:hypothetical protein
MYDNVHSTSPAHAPVNTFQPQVQDHISMLPTSSPRIDDHESPVVSHMQVEFAKQSNPTPNTPLNVHEFAVSNHPNLDIIFDGWETNSVKEMVLGMMTSSAQENFSHSPDESLRISHIDTSSDLANAMSDYLPTRVENRITAWLQDVKSSEILSRP